MIIKPLLRASSIYGVDTLMEYLLEINLKAIEELAYKDLYKNWAILLDNYSFHKEEVEAHKEKICNTLREIWKLWSSENPKGIPGWSLELPDKWYNTLKSTLYLIESDLLQAGKSQQVYDCWDIFFQEDIYRSNTYINRLGIFKL